MTTYLLIHGSGDGGWAWHLVQRELQALGHHAVAPDLPTDRDDATWDDCVEAVVRASRSAEGREVVVVGHSAGGFVVPLVAERLGAVLQVFVAGLVPRPGETADAWFDSVGWREAVAAAAARDGGRTGSADPHIAFYHDVPADLAAEALAHERATSERLGQAPWPLPALPPIPARYVVTSRDRFLPPAVQRQVAAERLGIAEPDEIDAGHCASLSRPAQLARLLDELALGQGFHSSTTMA
jgi:pimeloyl-ACP methyl ester carboxylesterase